MSKNNKSLSFTSPRVILLGLGMLSLIGTVLADSARVEFNLNGHYYQLIDTPTSWGQGQGICKKLGGHLATITSAEENGFVYVNFAVGSGGGGGLWIGGSDTAKKGTFSWVTNEKFTYSNFAGPQVDDYLKLDNYIYSPSQSHWITGTLSEVRSFICEWSAPNYVDITTVPDLNNNGVDETAALYVEIVAGKHTVKIRDPQTSATLSTLTFQTSFTPPQGVVALNDLNGNAIPEIGVLANDAVKNQPAVGIKDAKSNAKLLKTILFLDNSYEPKAISVVPDSNGNGSSEITVLGIRKDTGVPTAIGKAKSETRDSATGLILDETAF
jgi:hypothetical protein